MESIPTSTKGFPAAPILRLCDIWVFATSETLRATGHSIQLINRQTGVRLDLVGEGDLEGTISTGKALAASGALMAFEGPNEPNNFPITYNGQSGGGTGSWAPVAQFQEALYRAVKSTPIYKIIRSLRSRKRG